MSLIILRKKGRSITQGCKSIARTTSGQSLDLPKGENGGFRRKFEKVENPATQKIELFEGELTGYVRQFDLILIFSNRPFVAKRIFFFDFEEEAGPVQVFW